MLEGDLILRIEANTQALMRLNDLLLLNPLQKALLPHMVAAPTPLGATKTRAMPAGHGAFQGTPKGSKSPLPVAGKQGPGSRGGKVIGYDKTGKPIYEGQEGKLREKEKKKPAAEQEQQGGSGGFSSGMAIGGQIASDQPYALPGAGISTLQHFHGVENRYHTAKHRPFDKPEKASGLGNHEKETRLWHDEPQFEKHPTRGDEEAVGGLFHGMTKKEVKVAKEMKEKGYPHHEIVQTALEMRTERLSAKQSSQKNPTKKTVKKSVERVAPLTVFLETAGYEHFKS